MSCKRKKAWIGAAISAAAGIANAIISNNDKKKAQRKAEYEAMKQKGYNQAAALTNQYSNTDYIDDYNDRITFKNGGKYYDRLKRTQMFSCGGRKKADFGTEFAKARKEGKETFEYKGKIYGTKYATEIDNDKEVGVYILPGNKKEDKSKTSNKKNNTNNKSNNTNNKPNNTNKSTNQYMYIPQETDWTKVGKEDDWTKVNTKRKTKRYKKYDKNDKETNTGGGSYGEGLTGGGGASNKPRRVTIYEEKADTTIIPTVVPITFNEAFANARKKRIKNF